MSRLVIDGPVLAGIVATVLATFRFFYYWLCVEKDVNGDTRLMIILAGLFFVAVYIFAMFLPEIMR